MMRNSVLELLKQRKLQTLKVCVYSHQGIWRDVMIQYRVQMFLKCFILHLQWRVRCHQTKCEIVFSVFNLYYYKVNYPIVQCLYFCFVEMTRDSCQSVYFSLMCYCDESSLQTQSESQLYIGLMRRTCEPTTGV